MGYAYYGYEEERLQKKLIPLNFIVMLLALVAAVSLIFMPVITIDVGAFMTTMSEAEGGSGSEGSGELAMFESLKDAKVSVTAMGASKVALAADDKKAEAFVNVLFVDTGVFEKLMNSTMNVLLVAELCSNAENIDVGKLSEAFEELGAAKSKDEFTQSADKYVTAVAAAAGESVDADVKAEFINALGEMYDKSVEKVGAENFTLEAFVCVNYANQLNENGAKAEFTTYAGLIEYLYSDEAQAEGSDVGSLTETLKPLAEYAPYYGYVFYGLVFFAGIWALLALFALFHMLGKNKRFTMWYAKLFGGLPCLIFGGLTLVAENSSILATFGLELPYSLAGIFTTMTWISGACYLLMWVLSIFWAFPIKRKIRKLRRN